MDGLRDNYIMLSKPLEKNYDQPRQCIIKQTYYFTDKDPYSQGYDFSSSHAWI